MVANEPGEPFPWDMAIYDAHCHPTDTMSSIPSITDSMRARTLTVMATRSQDQDLVAQLATQCGVTSRQAITSSSLVSSQQRVIPAFGWHPWFSHQIYDDTTSDPSPLWQTDPDAAKRNHYDAVLVPSPSSRSRNNKDSNDNDNGKTDDDFLTHLPTPTPLSTLLSSIRQNLLAHPFALVGEIGIDKAFRLPLHGPGIDEDMTPGRRNGQPLSPYRVSMDHQIRIFTAQLKLAGEMGRAVSVHGVQAPGPLFETLRRMWKGHEKRVVSNRERKKIAMGVNEDFSSSDDDDDDGSDVHSDDNGNGKRANGRDDDDEARPKRCKSRPFPPRICLHSFSSGVQTLRQYIDDKRIPAKIFFSFSQAVNYSTGAHENARKKHIADDVIRECPDDRILLESDLHTAGQDMDDMLEKIYRQVCFAKGWDLRDGVERIKKNYEEFIIG